jgi:hypothetical protein
VFGRAHGTLNLLCIGASQSNRQLFDPPLDTAHRDQRGGAHAGARGSGALVLAKSWRITRGTMSTPLPITSWFRGDDVPANRVRRHPVKEGRSPEDSISGNVSPPRLM